MPTRVMTPPDPIVTLADVRRGLRIDASDDDAHLQILIDAAVEHLDAPNGWLGRALGVQTLVWSAPSFGCDRALRLPFPPVIEVTGISYLDAAGETQSFAADSYGVTDGLVWLRPGKSWPSIGCYPDAARITYRAGYATAADDTLTDFKALAPAIAAIILHVGHLEKNREAAADKAQLPIPMGYEALLSTFRIYSL